MPLHSVQHLSPTAILGLWHLTEPPEALWPLLPPAYRALIPPTAGPTRQAHWLGVRALAHALVEQLLPSSESNNLIIQNDAEGRPWLTGTPQPLEISLSHSGEWAAAIISTSGRAGIDIEIVRDKARRLASMFLSDDEMAAAAALPEASATQRYSLLWSAKETLYKLAARPGLIFAEQLLLDVAAVQTPLPDTSAAPLQLSATLWVSDEDIRHCICYSEPAPGYVLTYCHAAE
ncbi:4'-phosphopantetheinyl transferase superfamily protein [Hymenobacter sp. ASUV-10]|uniref:4'-phosphopantetheinyl transferase superfamily protein n=1 Tax=Hymenobacter aranciens TaxID=3063996 RepID=A0ABT9BE94_9BACT|nr:4'-phosphopantetheinyl transferase superfamily protein [Hymenobacter sp. ASUV-10]MDO7876585.1 4'-phosphopantetheinyl transferase superfamily protein [Hymenobacter sp. ASUV-10]